MKNSIRYSTLTLALLASVATFNITHAAPLDPLPVDPAMGTADSALPIKAGKKLSDGSYAGGSFDAYWGRVQVTANISGGRIASVKVNKFPSGKSTSRRINDVALPILEREVISAQGTRVNLVSGATLTSKAYLRSLNSALAKAGN